MAFDILQSHIKTLDQLFHNMADIDDMVDELTDAAKKETPMAEMQRRTGRHRLTSSRRSFSLPRCNSIN